MGHPAAGVQRQHAPAVLANQLQPADRWGQPCRAYNACIQPGPDAAAALVAIQESAQRLEPSLLRVPEPALHANLTWLLPVHKEFGAPKDELWQQHGPRWAGTLAEVGGRTSTFRLRYRRLAATNSAIITVADEPNGLSVLRRELVPLLRPPGGASAGDLVHMTLFRYAGPLHDPAALLRWADATEFCVDVHVSELVIIRERVFPSLDFDILHRVALAPVHA
jgi:hypothetical protein